MSKQLKEILLLDDDAQSRLLVNRILTNAGYRVFEAEDIEMALKLAQARVPHLVITDLMLKNENGFQYLERHRKIKELQGVPTLVLSGVKEKDAVYKALSLGAKDYVTKPIEQTILIQKLKKAMRDNKFAVVKLPAAKKTKVTLRANGTILMANEIGFLLEAPVRIFEDTPVQLNSALLRALACDNCVFQRTRLPARPGDAGQYLNDIAAVGLTTANAQRMREIVRSWK